MQWSDEAIVLSANVYGEAAYIVHLFTPEQGRHAGLVRGKKVAALLQPGNHLQVKWNARLSEHLGMMQVEMLKPYAALVMNGQERLAALMAACSLIEAGFPERDPHPEMYEMLKSLIEILAMGAQWQQAYVSFEHQLLTELGYGLDLTECAATGTTENLIYVSPKSGRAVSAEAGEPYKDKLFHLPTFFTSHKSQATNHDLAEGLKITGYFLERHWESVAHKPLPAPRARLVSAFTPARVLEMA